MCSKLKSLVKFFTNIDFNFLDYELCSPKHTAHNTDIFDILMEITLHTSNLFICLEIVVFDNIS